MKYDWTNIKQEYVQGIGSGGGVIYPTLEELSKKYGCNYGYLRVKAGKEKWTDQRDVYKAKIEQKVIENKTNKLAAQQSDFDFDIFQITKNLLSYAKVRMNKINEKIKKGGEPSLNEVDQLAKIVRQLQDIGKRALGEESGFDDAFKFKIEKV